MIGNITKRSLEIKYNCNIKKANGLQDSAWIAFETTPNGHCIGRGLTLSELDENMRARIEIDDI